MTVTFSSKMVEKQKKMSNKKVLTGRLFRKRIKKNKKLIRSGKHFVCVYILYYWLSADPKTSSEVTFNDEQYEFSEHF